VGMAAFTLCRPSRGPTSLMRMLSVMPGYEVCSI
jgi:hypothetical protein